jgi:hypothetical protein
MMLDRLQAAWGYTNAEIWRPLFDRYRDRHPDLTIEIVRVMLVRPRGTRQIFAETGKLPALDGLRADVATFLDLPGDARAAATNQASVLHRRTGNCASAFRSG